MKKLLTVFLSAMLVFALTACGETDNSDKTVSENSVESSTNADGEANSSEEENVAHEHSFEAISNNDGTHTIKCTGEDCTETSTESCVFNEEYVCETCGFKHEHTTEVAANEDGTHTIACTAEYCDYTISEDCSFDDEYVCETCGFKHEHTTEVAANEDGTHTIACTTEYCDYTISEDCSFDDEYVCATCGFKHEHTTEVKSNGSGKHTISCTAKYCDYSVTKNCTNNDNKCSTCGYEFPANPNAGKFMVYTKLMTFEDAVYYNSYDEICMTYFGVSWDTIKSTWSYVDDSERFGFPVAPKYKEFSADGRYTGRAAVLAHNGTLSAVELNGVPYYVQYIR